MTDKDNPPPGRESIRVQWKRFRYFPDTYRAARTIRRVPFEEAWRVAWAREHRLPLGYTAEVLRTHRAAGNRLASTLGIDATGGQGRHLACLRAAEVSGRVGMPARPESTSPGFIEVTRVIAAIEALGWETLDSDAGGIRIRLTDQAPAFAEQRERGEDFWLVWTEEGRWAWGTAPGRRRRPGRDGRARCGGRPG